MNPLFSIIIPTYNRAALLKVAIQSVIDQTFDDWEVIVVDDGSDDETKEVVDGFQNIPIQYFYQEKKERSAARNLGIAKACGQYICFLDDDDYFLNNHLSLLEASIRQEEYPVAIFRTGMITKYANKEVKSALFDSKKDKHPIPFFLDQMVGIHTLCYHREIFKTYQYDERWLYFEDTHLLIRCLLKYPFFQINVHTVVYMRYSEMGSFSMFRQKNAELRTENNINTIKDLFRQGGPKLLKYVPSCMESYLVAQKYLDHAGGALYVGRRRLAWTYLIQSLKINSGGYLLRIGKGRFLLIRYFKFCLLFILSFFRSTKA